MASRLDPLTLQNFLVVMPAFNEARFVGPVVKGIKSLGLDVLVVDDGSTDGTGEAAAGEGARVLRL